MSQLAQKKQWAYSALRWSNKAGLPRQRFTKRSYKGDAGSTPIAEGNHFTARAALHHLPECGHGSGAISMDGCHPFETAGGAAAIIAEYAFET